MKGAHWETYLWIHRIAGTVMTLCTIFYATYAYWQCAWVNYGGTHSKFAIPTLYCVSFIAIGGVLTRILLRRCKWRTREVLFVKNVHRIFAYILIIVGNAAVFTGINDNLGSYKWSYRVVGFLIAALLFLEVRFRIS